MLNLAVSGVVYQIEMLIAYIVFSYVGTKKYSAVITYLVGILIFSSGAVVNHLFSNTVWVNTTYTVFMNLGFALICFNIGIRSAAVYSVLMDMLSTAFEFFTVFFIAAFIGANVKEYNSNMSLLIIETAASKTLYLFSCILLLGLSKSKNDIGKIPASFYFFPISTLIALLSFWYISSHEELTYTTQMILSETSILLLCATVFLFITYRHNIERDNDYIRVKSEFDRLQTEKAYYDILEHQNQQLMIYAHDTKNHLAAIQSLSTSPEINKYIKKLSNQLGSYTKSCHSGNMILDVIINKYVTESEIRGITFDYDIKSCNLTEVEDIDLVSVLGNLMDNAITAAEKSSEKSVLLETTTRNSYNVVVISNSCDTVPKQNGTQLITTKEDKKIHGYGIRSVKKTLKKYHGDFSWCYDNENHLFIITIMIGTKL